MSDRINVDRWDKVEIRVLIPGMDGYIALSQDDAKELFAQLREAIWPDSKVPGDV